VYHAQLGSQQGLVEEILTHHRLTIGETIDLMSGVFHGARIPIAQLDFFSVLSQICADHLLEEMPSPEALGAFMKLLGTCSVVLGSAVDLPRLSSATAAQCYRGDHWYSGPPD